MDEKVQITVKAWTNRVGSEVATSFEINKEDWEKMHCMEQENFAREFIWNLVTWDYEVKEIG